ncbi:hypothetical protein B0H15DRAFT_860340 [Mycena belliarum]|uniref:PWWP domain-containing protein n=1 Tax=Mycena belliarum TaxID=1033014 RepID=A0AAD6TVA4_9AGAR|nr:hypothetical protein B0H15DRAFT_860340 [Mycena belliae]
MRRSARNGPAPSDSERATTEPDADGGREGSAGSTVSGGKQDGPGSEGKNEGKKKNEDGGGEQDGDKEDKKPVVAPPHTDDQLGRLVLPVGNRLEPGTLVWAKAASFPWWPAVVFDYSHPSIPMEVLTKAMALGRKREEFLYIVRYFDAAGAWQHLPLEKLRALGECRELDRDMLAVPSRRQKAHWKGRNIAQCRAAYKEALEEMESGDEKEGFVGLTG